MSTRIISQVWVSLLYELPLERLNGRTNLGNRDYRKESSEKGLGMISTTHRSNMLIEVDDYWSKEWMTIRVSTGPEGDGFIKVRTSPGLKPLRLSKIPFDSNSQQCQKAAYVTFSIDSCLSSSRNCVSMSQRQRAHDRTTAGRARFDR